MIDVGVGSLELSPKIDWIFDVTLFSYCVCVVIVSLPSHGCNLWLLNSRVVSVDLKLLSLANHYSSNSWLSTESGRLAGLIEPFRTQSTTSLHITVDFRLPC